MFSLNTVANARELGGYILPDGSKIRQGLLLRGGSLAKASDADLRRMSEEFHVTKIFDFRTGIEVGHAPDRDVPGARNIWMPAFDEKSMEMKDLALPSKAYQNLGEWLVLYAKEEKIQKVAANMYKEMVTNEFTQVQYAGFMQNILFTTEGAVFWHCSQGKDRTGFGAALVLAALGADRDLIMKDFAISNEFYANELSQYLPRVETDAEKRVIQTFIGVNCDYFEAALDLIDSTWGSMDAFLRGPICLEDEDIRTLRERYLE